MGCSVSPPSRRSKTRGAAPFATALRAYPSLPKDRRYVAYCELGLKSAHLAELMCRDALARNESCGCHLREEHQTEEGEAIRDDERFAKTHIWEWKGEDTEHEVHEEPLGFESIELATRSYK